MSAWYTLSQESGTFGPVLQGRDFLRPMPRPMPGRDIRRAPMLFLRVKLFLRTDGVLLLPGLVLYTQLVNCLRGAPRNFMDSIVEGWVSRSRVGRMDGTPFPDWP